MMFDAAFDLHSASLTHVLAQPSSPAEVENARQRLHDVATGSVITRVETTEDNIVFVDLEKDQFVRDFLRAI